MKMHNKYLLIEPIKQDNISRGGIHMPESYLERVRKAVVKLSSDEEYSPNSKIVYDGYSAMDESIEVSFDGKQEKFVLIKTDQVIMTL